MRKETHQFQAEVGQLLDIVAHALYSQKEIFLRELISNGADACDKVRYALASGELKAADLKIQGDYDPKIILRIEKKNKTLHISDNGIGMNKEDLESLLGTIARSGTRAFVEQFNAGNTKDKKNKDENASLIGQFGVGFYSSFMVADSVDVITKKAGEEHAWHWSSDGRGSYTIEKSERTRHGSDIVLHIAKDDKEYLDPVRLRHVVKTWSDHIRVPVYLYEEGKKDSDEELLSSAEALWTRPKSDITQEQYTEFYHEVAHAFDKPWLTIHNAVEGVLSYTNLLFIPDTKPFNLYTEERKNRLRLYVKRVFISDSCEELLPAWLRFVQGIVDSEDISLNISREMLQHDPKLMKIRTGLVKRILGELEKKAKKSPEQYNQFWENFGPLLKEGLYEDSTYRERLLALLRFKTTMSDGLVNLAEYVENAKAEQKAIYYITGENAEQVAKSPQLEGFRDKGIEVLLLSDPIDDFWINSVGDYQDKPFRSVTRSGDDLDDTTPARDKDDKDADGDDATAEDTKTKSPIDALIAHVKVSLGDKVQDVKSSSRLTSSAVCLVAGAGSMDIHMERMLRQHGRDLPLPSSHVLEINPTHPLIVGLQKLAQSGDANKGILEEGAWLLLDQARILEGEPPADIQAFSKRLNSVMERALRGKTPAKSA